ncbi:bifunctional adenosylcobinamide kinase/adenosylcobinamide-phosphate guanylyltransferase [Edwardsiella hoshinae]|uniref:Bifunctional adenosylcobalamin biosynthesis protein n=1 Tax=Edwardsiella hoshinae TaxID=93378 RepID=A0A376DFD7_9GAMM|nr:bifunctional adenosylcobinamide kinase/adenosylcobinamide-phosphate guanylyltransferase [Edwardsiella hoshinae]AOV97039.1 bifunctional adenosylcobinamide kinase/adenosylcobinamide-phosphate guanylyltransferase [Edwardsiella hoshinae]QPR27110.1 bifunctional adenosylcobinamide kinase/adenosylcobinamide-phosphate guanylyltransferase [Edwardsiella hoshinae]STC88435.1 Adenosylcobinamide kinase [Edwardsiella hoshinae]
MLTLITGGARSGKSALAERLAGAHGARVLYIATSLATDDEMAARIAHHRAARPANWRTHEGFTHLDQVIAREAPQCDAIMLECVTTLITNLLFAEAGDLALEALDFARLEATIQHQVTALAAACRHSACPVYVVTNEVGMGIVPEHRLARHFRDIAGRVNQRLAAEARQVYLVVSGIEMKIKG